MRTLDRYSDPAPGTYKEFHESPGVLFDDGPSLDRYSMTVDRGPGIAGLDEGEDEGEDLDEEHGDCGCSANLKQEIARLREELAALQGGMPTTTGPAKYARDPQQRNQHMPTLDRQVALVNRKIDRYAMDPDFDFDSDEGDAVVDAALGRAAASYASENPGATYEESYEAVRQAARADLAANPERYSMVGRPDRNARDGAPDRNARGGGELPSAEFRKVRAYCSRTGASYAEGMSQYQRTGGMP